MEHIELAVFEFVLEGYYNDTTDKTDHLIKWVAAPSMAMAKAIMTVLGFKWDDCIFCEELSEKDFGIDLIIRDSLFTN